MEPIGSTVCKLSVQNTNPIFKPSPLTESPKTRVLFVCIHNSARSQIAEALMNHLYGRSFHAESAGLSPGELNPLAVEVMREVGVDISRNATKGVFDFFKDGRMFEYVITVCDEANGERCPAFPGVRNVLHWNFPDPSTFTGAPHERLQNVRRVRDAIKIRLTDWVHSLENNRGESG